MKTIRQLLPSTCFSPKCLHYLWVWCLYQDGWAELWRCQCGRARWHTWERWTHPHLVDWCLTRTLAVAAPFPAYHVILLTSAPSAQPAMSAEISQNRDYLHCSSDILQDHIIMRVKNYCPNKLKVLVKISNPCHKQTRHNKHWHFVTLQ